MPLSPQAALEQAVVNLLRAAPFSYSQGQCDRTFDGRPPPRMGPWFVAVWSGGRRGRGQGDRGALDGIFDVSITVTVRTQQAFDHLIRQRDDVEARLNDLTAAVAKDTHSHIIRDAANTLAGYRDPNAAPGSAVAGFIEALAWDYTEDVRVVDGSWFWATTDKLAGLTQTAHFGRARHVQNLATC